MSNIIGSIREVVLDGTTFNVFPDSNIKEVGSGYENAAVPTSGPTLRKMTKRVQTREGVVVACNGAEREILKELSERTSSYPMSYMTASGDVYRAQGFIEFESRETEENRATLQLIPEGDWEAFLAA